MAYDMPGRGEDRVAKGNNASHMDFRRETSVYMEKTRCITSRIRGYDLIFL